MFEFLEKNSYKRKMTSIVTLNDNPLMGVDGTTNWMKLKIRGLNGMKLKLQDLSEF